MTNGDDRFSTAQWILERQLGWIASADSKVGVVVAIQTAMLGGLAAAFGMATHRTEWALITTVAAAICSIAALICTAFALFPRTDGPKKSLLFFGCICKLEPPAFKEQLRSATDMDLLEDCSDQIHRNAEIAGVKHRWVQNALIWSFCSAPSWIIAIRLLLQHTLAI